MRAAFVIAGRILRQRIRDRSALIFAVLTPLGLALAFSAIIPDFTTDFHTTVAIVDEDGGEAATALVAGPLAGLASSGVADLRTLGSEADARAAVAADEVGVAIVIPAGFTQAIHSSTPTEVRILGGSNPTAREVARATVSAFAAVVDTSQLSIRTVIATGGSADPATITRIRASLLGDPPIALSDALAARGQASMATFYGAAMAIMFVFFATQYGALAILAERRIGTLNRLLATPVRHASVILGGSIAGFVLGLLAMTILVVATTLIAHASWGPPPLVALLVVAAVVAAIGISTLVATLAKTVEQAGGLNAIIALCLAAIGGVFIPLSHSPELLARVSLITPHAWFLRAIDTLTLPTATLGDIAQPVVVLVAMGVVTGAVGLVRANRAMVPA
jgi:linearmycin/streptolysin S transport system permease protein